MKHLRKFNESNSEELKQEILDNFISISDKFGEPQLSCTKFGDNDKWSIVWKIPGLRLSLMQPASEVVEKLQTITSQIEDVISASSRLSDWDFTMSLDSELVIEMTPKETGSDTFEFIKEYSFRSLYIIANEVERFFKSRGVIVTKFDVDSSWNEYSQTNDLQIFLNIPNSPAREEFQRLLESELEEKKNEIDREYQVWTSTSKITIGPQEEKAGVEII